MYLEKISNICKKVTMIVRKDDFTGENYLVENSYKIITDKLK